MSVGYVLSCRRGSKNHIKYHIAHTHATNAQYFGHSGPYSWWFLELVVILGVPRSYLAGSWGQEMLVGCVLSWCRGVVSRMVQCHAYARNVFVGCRPSWAFLAHIIKTKRLLYAHYVNEVVGHGVVDISCWFGAQNSNCDFTTAIYWIQRSYVGLIWLFFRDSGVYHENLTTFCMDTS